MSTQITHGLATPTESIDSEQCSNTYFIPSQVPRDASSLSHPARLSTKLQFSSLMESMKTASIINEDGFWSGTQEDESLRLDLLNMCLQLQRMLSTPVDLIQNIAQAHHLEAALRYAVSNNLADYIPRNGSTTYHNISAAAGVNEHQCQRIMRMLIAHQIFCEPMPNTITHTPASIALSDPNMQAWVQYSTTDSMRSSTYLVDALKRWPGSSKPSETGFNLAHDTSLPMFEYFGQAEDKLTTFRKAMIAMARQPAVGASHAVSGYPWHKLNADAVVVDVGGGRGHVSSAVADAFPSLAITVQDIGIAQAYNNGDIEFERYNFFEQQPIKNADVYFLRQVLHDWSDEFAVTILRNQVAAMSPQSKLVIMEIVMPEPGEATLLEERRSRTTDITMMTLFNAQEREMSEWLALMKKTDSRLHLTHCSRPATSLLSIMEFSLRGEQ